VQILVLQRNIVIFLMILTVLVILWKNKIFIDIDTYI